MYYIKVLFLLPEGAESGPIPSMVPLSTDNVDFINDLEKLDRQSTRTAETVYIFYMKNGQKHPDEILRNVAKADHVNRVFLDFLASLGWPVNVWHHTGWTGRLSTRQASFCVYLNIFFEHSSQMNSNEFRRGRVTSVHY